MGTKIINPDLFMDVENCVYAVLIVIPTLIYKDRPKVEVNPVVLKVGYSAGNLIQRLLELGKISDYGASHIFIIGVVIYPPEGVNNSEKDTHKCLRERKLLVGIVSISFKRKKEAFVPDNDTVRLIYKKFNEYNKVLWADKMSKTVDPFDLLDNHIHEPLSFLESSDSLSTFEINVLAKNTILPSMINMIADTVCKNIVKKYLWIWNV
jgi:hypothetical protein